MSSEANNTISKTPKQFQTETGNDAMIIAPWTDGNRRNSEGDIIELEEGKFLILYNHFVTSGDHDSACIYGIFFLKESNKQIFSDPFKLEIDSGKMNVMSPSLLRDPDSGKILLIVAEKNSTADIAIALYELIYDNKKSGAEQIRLVNKSYIISPGSGYYNAITPGHCKFVVTDDGRHRLCLPIARIQDVKDYPRCSLHIIIYYCDDPSRIDWKTSTSILYPEQSNNSFEEPDIVQLGSGDVYMIICTTCGELYYSLSSDHGSSWHQPLATGVKNSRSPVAIGLIPDSDRLWMLLNGPEQRKTLLYVSAKNPSNKYEIPNWSEPYTIIKADSLYSYDYPICKFTAGESGLQAIVLVSCYQYYKKDSQVYSLGFLSFPATFFSKRLNSSE